jgi:hypothetical protein
MLEFRAPKSSRFQKSQFSGEVFAVGAENGVNNPQNVSQFVQLLTDNVDSDASQMKPFRYHTILSQHRSDRNPTNVFMEDRISSGPTKEHIATKTFLIEFGRLWLFAQMWFCQWVSQSDF